MATRHISHLTRDERRDVQSLGKAGHIYKEIEALLGHTPR
jgi:IS30 family transposase